MKRNTLRFAAFLAVALFLPLLPLAPARLSADNSQTAATSAPAALPTAGTGDTPFAKDETVYGLLAFDGSVKSVDVVNHLSGSPGSWNDFGDYTTVESLTAGIVPDIQDGRIRISSPDGSDTYYQGTLDPAKTQLPFRIAIGYSLDGVPIDGALLADASGVVKITLKIAPNADADAGMRDRLMTQANIALDLLYARNIDAPGASRMIAGRTCTLNYTVLPGQSSEHTLTFTAVRFRMSPITITAIPAQAGAFGMTELTGGLGSLSEGGAMLADSGSALAAGLAELASGLSSLSQGLAATNAGMAPLLAGLTDGVTGLKKFSDQTAALSNGAAAIAPALSTLATQGAELVNGYARLATAMSALPANEGLTAALAQMASLNAGLQAAVQGLQALSTQYAPLSKGIAALPGGAASLNTGFSGIRTGLAKTAGGIQELAVAADLMTTQSAPLPKGAADLAAGQRTLADALVTLQTETSRLMGGTDEALRSFAAPGKIVPRSVQFLLHTTEIAPAATDGTTPADTTENLGFFQRLIHLFQK